MDVRKKLRNTLIGRIQRLSVDKLNEISHLLGKIENRLNAKRNTLQLGGSWKDLDDEIFLDLTDNLHENRNKDRQITSL